MTPEQEILEDALAAVRQRLASADELVVHNDVFPIDFRGDWNEFPLGIRTHIAAFSKRYELTADHITRKLSRSILANAGTLPRNKAMGEVIDGVAALGIIDDREIWYDIVATRNTLTHDYMIEPPKLVEVINKAWAYAPDLIAVVQRAEDFVDRNDLLRFDGKPDHA